MIYIISIAIYFIINSFLFGMYINSDLELKFYYGKKKVREILFIVLLSFAALPLYIISFIQDYLHKKANK